MTQQPTRSNRYAGQTHLSCDQCGNRFTVRHNICPACGSKEVCNYVPTQADIAERAEQLKQVHYAKMRSWNKDPHHDWIQDPQGRGSIDTKERKCD